MVDRYRPTVADVQATAYCGPHPDGEYVKVADYDALAARLAEAEAVHAVVCKEVHDGELNECRLEARLAEAERLIRRAYGAVGTLRRMATGEPLACKSYSDWQDEADAWLRAADSAPAVLDTWVDGNGRTRQTVLHKKEMTAEFDVPDSASVAFWDCDCGQVNDTPACIRCGATPTVTAVTKD